MRSQWVDPGDAEITELDGGTGGPSGGPGHTGRGSMPSAFVFAAGAVVGGALVLAIMEQPPPAPAALATSALSSSPSAPPTPVPASTPAPSIEEPPRPVAVHLPAGSPVSVEINGMLVTLTVPPSFESDYFAPHLLATGRPNADGLAITTTDLVGSGCLGLDGGGDRSPGSTEPTATPAEGPPGTLAARGPLRFTLDDYLGHYFHFVAPADACQPNHVWDSIVGDFGPRGPHAQLELWALDVSGTTLVFGSYRDIGASPSQLDEVRAVVASAHVVPIHAPSADLTPAVIGAGFVGLPPAGAEPGGGADAELVDQYAVHGGELPFRGMARVYDDGRLIWYMLHDGPAGSNAYSTGYLEQRLTPVGVAMVQAHADLAEKDPLALAAWLPPGAWEDREIRAYVPTGYAACLVATSPAMRFGQLLLNSLPTTAADLLSGEPLTWLVGAPPGWDCRGLTTEDARTLDAELASAGLEQSEERNRYVLEYQLEGGEVTLEPILPDSSIGCSSCG